MKVFLKYVIKSMTEKKGRFVLLITAIAISTALLVASTGLIDIILDSLVAPQLEAYENQEIVISPKDESSSFYSDEGIQLSGIDEDSIIKELYMQGMIVDKAGTDDETMLNVSVRGRDKEFVNNDIITQGSIDTFEGESCIISERTANERGLALGDSIDIIIGGKTITFHITAISGASGVFYNDAKTAFAVIIPYEYISKDFAVEGKYNFITANSSESTIEKGIEKFNKNNTSFSAEILFDEEDAKEQLSSFSSLLYIMLIVVVFMSAIIIYSSFKLIITERLSTIGTFLSQGATTFKVKSILYIESIAYGFFGALFGNILGVIGLYVINRIISPLKEYGIYSKVSVKPYYIVYGIIFSVVLSIISAYLPVRRISKLQVKDIILNDVRISKSIGFKKCIVGMILIVVSVGLYLICKDNLKGYSALLFVLSLTGVILAYPKVIDLLSRLLYHIFRGKSRNVILAINNLRTSKILLGNITLIIISLVSIITITSLGTSMINVVTEAYTSLKFDIQINNISTIRENTEVSTENYVVEELKKMKLIQ